MFVSFTHWPMWIQAAVVAPLALLVGAPMFGWWPKNAREWRYFGALLGCFAVFCIVVIGLLHHI